MAVIKRVANISKNSLESSKVRLSGVMHEEADLLDNICNVGSGKCQILKGTS